MTSYVFTVIEKRYHWHKVHEILTSKYEDDFELIFALRSSCPEKQELLELEKKLDNVKVLEFEDSTSENAMISQAIKQAEGLEMVLCRDYFDYDTIKSDFLLAMNLEGAQVILFKKESKKGKLSKVKKFFSKLYNKLVKFVFGFSLYNADVGLIYFSNLAFDVLKTLPSNVLLTKVNKWSGFEISYVTVDELEKPKLEKKEKRPLVLWTVFTAIALSLIVTGFVLLAVFNKLSFLIGLLLAFGFLIGCFVLTYTILKLSIICKYGDLKA